MSSSDTKAYSGADVLDVMAEAKNYNQYLVKLVLENRRTCSEIVDYGAGTGTFAKLLLQHTNNIQCIEPDSALSAKLAEAGFSVHASISQLNQIEYLYSLNVLEHIEDDESAVLEIFSRMKSGGKVFFYVPAFMLLYNSLDKKLGTSDDTEKDQIVNLFENAGFIIDESRYVDSLGFFAALVFKHFGNSEGDINLTVLKLYDRLFFPSKSVL